MILSIPVSDRRPKKGYIDVLMSYVSGFLKKTWLIVSVSVPVLSKSLSWTSVIGNYRENYDEKFLPYVEFNSFNAIIETEINEFFFTAVVPLVVI